MEEQLLKILLADQQNLARIYIKQKKQKKLEKNRQEKIRYKNKLLETQLERNLL